MDVLKEINVGDLRKAVRKFIPEERGAGGLGNVGKREDLIRALEIRGVMPDEVQEFLAGAENLQAPKDNGLPFTPQSGDENNGQDGENQEAQEKQQQLPQIDEKDQPQNDNEQQDELEIIRQIITKNSKNAVDEKKVAEIVKAEFQTLKKDMVKVIEVKQPNGLPNKPIGACHKLTEQIAKVCNLGIHQMLVGPAGGGKTTTCEKVAEILNLKFFPMSVGPQTTKSDLLGFIDAHGNYHATPLREAFENGGLLLLDEMDAANAGVLTIINALLANGYCSFPDGIKKRHEQFRCICACNTFGRGADRQYVGRNQLDAATLDRFAVVDFDYDDDLERLLAGNNDWVEQVQRYRAKAWETRQRVVISPRASIFGAKLLASGMKKKEVEELVVWKGVSPEIKSKIQG